MSPFLSSFNIKLSYYLFGELTILLYALLLLLKALVFSDDIIFFIDLFFVISEAADVSLFC